MRRRTAIIIAVAILALILVALVADEEFGQGRDVTFGATFSNLYAEQLGLDWHATYTAVLDDLGVRRLRIPAYWNKIETQEGHFDFTDLDWQINEASKRGAEVIVAMGRRAPRWPECYVPDWAKDLDEPTLERKTLAMIAQVVRRYKGERAVISWQVENEPFYPFGGCTKQIPAAAVAQEAAAVRMLDSRPVLMQDIGEFSLWLRTAKLTDTLGVSMYRIAWDRRLGYIRWPGIALWYRARGALARWYAQKVIITEMQAEPWTTKPIQDVPIDEQLKQMNPDALASNVAFARRIGFPETYVWGIEWWYWLGTKGHPEMWDAGKKIFRP